MSKTFKGGMDSLLGDSPKNVDTREEIVAKTKDFLRRVATPVTKVEPAIEPSVEIPNKLGRPRTNNREITKTSQKGAKEGETRATFILEESLLENIKAISYWDRLLIKDVVTQALEEYVAKYEKKNGSIKAIKK